MLVSWPPGAPVPPRGLSCPGMLSHLVLSSSRTIPPTIRSVWGCSLEDVSQGANRAAALNAHILPTAAALLTVCAGQRRQVQGSRARLDRGQGTGPSGGAELAGVHTVSFFCVAEGEPLVYPRHVQTTPRGPHPVWGWVGVGVAPVRRRHVCWETVFV